MTKYSTEEDRATLISQPTATPVENVAPSKSTWKLRMAAVVGLGLAAGIGYATTTHFDSTQDTVLSSDLSASQSSNPFDSCEVAELVSNTGDLLARCDGCGVASYPDVVTMPRSSVGNSTFATWKVESQPNGAIALKSDKGQYLGPGSVDGAALQPSNIWSVHPANGGVYLQSESGKYLSRCQSCKPNSNEALSVLHSTTKDDPWVHWKVNCLQKAIPKIEEGQFVRCEDTKRIYRFSEGELHFSTSHSIAASYDRLWQNAPDVDCSRLVEGSPLTMRSPIDQCTSGMIALQSDTGKYLARCNGCVRGAYPDSATLHVNNFAGSYAKWRVVKVDEDTIALQADTRKFLGRCNRCIYGYSAYPDSAFVHGTSPNQAYTHWKVETLSNGKVALKGNAGKYLARCNGCASGNPRDRAFVHATNPGSPWVQWKVVCA